MNQKVVKTVDNQSTPPASIRGWRKHARHLCAGLVRPAGSTLVLTACSTGGYQSGYQEICPEEKNSSEYPGYLANSELTTVYAGSAFGTASVASQLSGRLYPGAFVSGPTRQLVPHSDLVTTHAWLGGDQRNLLYTVTEDATYSER